MSGAAGGSLAKGRAIIAAEVLGIVAAVGALGTTLNIVRAWMKARRIRRMLKDVPFSRYPNQDGFFGFLPWLVTNRRRMNDMWMEATSGMPMSKMYGLKFEPHAILLFRDPECIRHFLKDSFDKYTKPRLGDGDVFFDFIIEWLGNGIFTMRHGKGSDDDGNGWMSQRKIAASIFSRGNFQNNMGEVFTDKAKLFVKMLERPAAAGDAVDIQALFFGFTMDSIMQIFFGEKANTMEGGACAYATAFDDSHRNLMEYVRSSFPVLALLTFVPWPVGGTQGLASRILGVSNRFYRDFRRSCRVLSDEAERILVDARRDPRLSKRKDLLALFMQAEETGTHSNAYLRDMVLNFVIAGRDTTACLLSWLFFVLSTEPAVQAKLQAEIDEHLPNGMEPTLKLLAPNTMPYLNGVIYETLRLYPSVPFDSKMCYEDDVLPNGTQVPKGAILQWMPYSMGRDPAVYPEPMVVRPERWIPFKAPPHHEFPVFQAGPRLCLGMDMALFEAKLVTAMLLQKYSFTLKPGEREKIHYSATITMAVCNSKDQDSHNLWVIPKVRSK